MKKTTLIAVAVFCALAVAYVATREPQVAVGVRKLTPAAVKADALVSLQAGPLTLTTENGAWKVSREGKTWAADSDAVTRFAQALAEFKATDFVTDKVEKHAEYEVDDAKGLVVRASTRDGVVRDLVLGKASKLGGAYVRQAGSKDVFVLSGQVPWLARRGLAEWRNRRIEVAKREALERVTLTPVGGAPATLVVTADAEPKLEGPSEPGYRFDTAAANRLLQQLTSLSAQDFTEDPVTPAFTVTLGLKGGAAKTLTLGSKRADGTVPLTVEGDPQTYLLSSWVAESLQKDREGLRDLQLLTFTPADVERVTLSASGSRTVVERKGETWTLVEPKAPPANFEFDPAQVERQLAQLGGLRATRAAKDVTDARAGLPRPTAELELRLKGGAVRRLAIGAKTGEGLDSWARGQDPFVVVVPESVPSLLRRGVELFKRQPAPQAMGPGALQGLEQLPPEVRAQLEAQLRPPR